MTLQPVTFEIREVIFEIREAGYYDREPCAPDGRFVSYTQCPEEATELYCYYLAHTKYPHCVELRTIERVFDNNGKLKAVNTLNYTTPLANP